MHPLTRRRFLHANTFGVGSVALAYLLDQERLLANPTLADAEKKHFDLKPKKPHHAPRARAMISLFMQGGPSHMDLLDPKPKLNELDGKPFPGTIKYDNAAQASSKVLGCPWKFAKSGRCGTEVSELLPHLARVIDEVCVVRSMHTGVNNHVQGIHALNTGRIVSGHPVLGSWVCYGLGSESQELPAFVALPDPVSLPVSGVEHWSNGWLPSVFQGTVVRPREPRIPNLDAPPHLKGTPQAELLNYLGELNREHLAAHPGELDLEARIAGYELAAKMQTAAKVGRDHNTYGFTWWFAGGGFRAGLAYGATDEFGHHAVEKVVTQHDLHATLLHLFGLDAKKLVYKRGATELSLLNGQDGKVVTDLFR